MALLGNGFFVPCTMAEINGYDLSRNFWNWAFDNPEKISPNHAAVYFFAIEHCNRLGWKEKFGFPSQMAMDAIGIKKHSTYIRYFRDLVKYGFFTLIQESKNQYSSNIISLANALPKKGEALDKAIVKHVAKQSLGNGQSIRQSIGSINKQVNQETIEPLNQETNDNDFFENENLENADFEKMGFKGKAKQIWKTKFKTYVWQDDDETALVKLENLIKTFIQQKNKSNGQSEFGANKDEILKTYETIISNPPQFYADKMSVSIIVKKFNEFTSESFEEKKPIHDNGQHPKSIPKPIKQDYR